MLLIGTDGEPLRPRISLLILDLQELPIYSLSDPLAVVTLIHSVLVV
jgi:hypothetical protein